MQYQRKLKYWYPKSLNAMNGSVLGHGKILTCVPAKHTEFFKKIYGLSHFKLSMSLTYSLVVILSYSGSVTILTNWKDSQYLHGCVSHFIHNLVFWFHNCSMFHKWNKISTINNLLVGFFYKFPLKYQLIVGDYAYFCQYELQKRHQWVKLLFLLENILIEKQESGPPFL